MAYTCNECKETLRLNKNIDYNRVKGDIMFCFDCLPDASHLLLSHTRQAKVRRGELLSKRDISVLKTKCRRGIQLTQKLNEARKPKKKKGPKRWDVDNIYRYDRKRVDLNKREKKMQGWNTRVGKLHKKLQTYLRRNYCYGCNDKLIVGENITEPRVKNSDYICKGCLSKKWVPTGGSVGRPSLVFDTYEEAQAHKRQLKLDEVERKKKAFPPGVYGIFRNGKLAYIGESFKMYARIYSGHFKWWSVEAKDKSPVCNIVNKENFHEWKWAYLAYENDDNKRIAIEQQYINRYVPYLNAPFRHFSERDYASFSKAILAIDKGGFDMENLEFYPSDKTLLVPDGVNIKRIESKPKNLVT